MRFIVTVALSLFATVTQASSASITCDATSWFNTNNDSGVATFSFGIEYEERNGQIVNFDSWNLRCEQFQDISFSSNEIYIKCSSSPLQGLEHNGDSLRTFMINRSTGKFELFSTDSKMDLYYVYEGYCGVSNPKF